MNITLKLNGEPIKYGVCHIYSNSGLSTPVILSNGNGSGGNTITASINGIVALTATNCPSSIYCKIESNPSVNNSANFRLKTNKVANISPSAAARTLDMGFTSNIFVPTDTKSAIGYDLLTLGYRYSFSKITPSNYTIPTGTSTNMLLYKKAFTYKAINSLDKTGYGSTTTQTTFGTYSSGNVTNMLNTTRGVNLAISNYTIQLDGLHKSGDPLQSQTAFGNKYTISGVSINIAGYTIDSSNVIINRTITPSVNANNSYLLNGHANNHPGLTDLFKKGTLMNYAYNSGWIPLTCFNIPAASPLAGKLIDNNADVLLVSADNLILTYYYNNTNFRTEMIVSFCLCEIDKNSTTDADYYKMLSYCNNTYTIQPISSSGSNNYEEDIYVPISFKLGKNYSSGNIVYNTPNSFYFKQNTTYALFVRIVYGLPSLFEFVRLGANVNGSLGTSIFIEMPERVVTFEKVGKSPLVPVYMALKSTIISCNLSYLQISYPNHSYSLGNSSNRLGKNTVTSQLKWLNANPAKIGTSTVSYTNLYSGINVSAKNSMNSTRDVYTYAYIAMATPAVCYNNFTTTNWHILQSTKSYTTNNVFNINAITSTNIKYSINELLSGKHKLTEIYVRVDS